MSDMKELCYDSSGFVCLSDVIPDAIIEARYYSDFNFVGERIDGYEDGCLLFSHKGAQALICVAEKARALGYRLKIYDAYRPMRAIRHFLRWMGDCNIKMKELFYPDTDKSDIVENGYISPRSAHARGCAVDLTLVDASNGEELDMGGPFDFFGECSHYAYGNLTEEQRENRRVLRDIMTQCHFKPISTEWWHFALADEPFPDTFFDFPVSRNSLK